MEIQTAHENCPICAAEVEMPLDTIEAMARAPGQIGEAVRSAPSQSGEGWSPAEVLTHLADSEVVDGWRIRQILAEDEPTIQPFDQEKWATALRYQDRDPILALEAFGAARHANLEILRLLSDEEWQRTYVQPEYGRQTLRNFIRHLSDHDIAHLKQIRGA